MHRQLEAEKLEREREKIRELHLRQQDSLKSLEALEQKLNEVTIMKEPRVHNPSLDSSTSTLLTMPDAPGQRQTAAAFKDQGSLSDESSDSEQSEALFLGLNTHDSRDNKLLGEAELAKCAKHVRRLLQRINKLQRSITSGGRRTCNTKTLNGVYKKFCYRWEMELLL